MVYIFLYTIDLTFGEFCGHFWTEMISGQKFDYFCLYLPEVSIDMLKHDTKVKVLLNETTWFLIGIPF